MERSFVVYWNDREDEPVAIFDITAEEYMDVEKLAYENGGSNFDDYPVLVEDEDWAEDAQNYIKNTDVEYFVLNFSEVNKKQQFVKELSEVLSKYIPSVDYVELDAFTDAESGCDEEYIVMHYNGGAIACRNAYINSNLANLEEITKLCFGGYYDEVDDYRKLKEKCK